MDGGSLHHTHTHTRTCTCSRNGLDEGGLSHSRRSLRWWSHWPRTIGVRSGTANGIRGRKFLGGATPTCTDTGSGPRSASRFDCHRDSLLILTVSGPDTRTHRHTRTHTRTHTQCISCGTSQACSPHENPTFAVNLQQNTSQNNGANDIRWASVH